MTDKELFKRNLEISSEFSRYIIEHPEVAKQIGNAEVIFLLESDPELCKANIKLARKLKEASQPVIFVKIKSIRPVEESRLIKPHLEFAA